MATALLVPVTFFMPPVPAIAAIVTATAMAIFAGDIPSALLRMPGTPASAAYTDEAYLMTKKGQAEVALGAGLVFSVLGGIFGVLVLIVAAPALAEVALKFSSFEYFWLVMLGFTCAIFIAGTDPLKGVVALLLGLLIACVGLDNPAGAPRYTFGSAELTGGISLIPLMIGMFAISEILRFASGVDKPLMATTAFRQRLRRHVDLVKKYPRIAARLGTLARRRRAARRRRRHRGVDGLCHVEALFQGAAEVRHGPCRRHRRIGRGQQLGAGRRVDSGAGVRHSRRFHHRHRHRRALPEGHESGADAVRQQPAEHLRGVHRLHPGAAADVALRLGRDQGGQAHPAHPGGAADAADPAVLHRRQLRHQQQPVRRRMLVAGVVAFGMERWGFPIAPTILGVVLGTLLEEHFFSSLVKADGNFFVFFERPIAGALGVLTLLVWLWPVVRTAMRRMRDAAPS
jgi:hypothetical protein